MGTVEGQLGITGGGDLGRFGMNRGPIRDPLGDFFLTHEGDYGVILGPLWAYRRRMAGMMRVVAGLMVSLSTPSGPISRKYTFFQRILLFKEATRAPGKVCS